MYNKNRAKAIATQATYAYGTQDGSREWITVAGCTSTGKFMLSPMVWEFYELAKREAYTKSNIKSA